MCVEGKILSYCSERRRLKSVFEYYVVFGPPLLINGYKIYNFVKLRLRIHLNLAVLIIPDGLCRSSFGNNSLWNSIMRKIRCRLLYMTFLSSCWSEIKIWKFSAIQNSFKLSYIRPDFWDCEGLPSCLSPESSLGSWTKWKLHSGGWGISLLGLGTRNRHHHSMIAED